ncbi:carbamoyltransferase [Candidatus Margulisiibacteriota bacterium]
MYILGISGFYHDSAACLIKDGEIIAAAEEERFNRKKHTAGLPINAIKYCLEHGKITLNEIDYIGYYMKHGKLISYYIKDMMFFKRPLNNSLQLIAYSIYLAISLEIEKHLCFKEKLGGNKNTPKIIAIDHHLSHAAGAFFVSPFESSAILIIDLKGESAATSFYLGKKNKVIKTKNIDFPHSLGVLYASITDYLGFIPVNDEYKIMGLASYGKLDLHNEFEKIVHLKPKGEYAIDLSYFNFHETGRFFNAVSNKFINIFGPPRRPNESISQHHKDIAACLQKLTEETILHMINYLHSTTNENNLCIAGGVGLNSVANGKILKQSKFKNIFVQPSAHDAGCAVGCAYYLYNQVLGKPRNHIMNHDYFGPEYSDREIEEALQNSKVKYSCFPDIEKIIAKLLSEGKIIGWFQGRMEFGPRALGNRSILADPTRKDMTDIVNKWVKHREDFRPFAPAVLDEEASKYFELDRPSPFMLFVVPVREEMKNRIPAVTHVDGTARVQTVNKKTNLKFWNLINEFKNITGIPIILNTSFNIKGEPVVCTPKDALRCFFSTGIDYLVMGNYLIGKEYEIVKSI